MNDASVRLESFALESGLVLERVIQLYKEIYWKRIKISVTLPTHVDGTRVSPAVLDEDQEEEIKNIKFNNDLRHDFPGVGFGDETVNKLAGRGIANTNQLFGEMLRHFDQSQPTSDNLSKFWKRLGELGCAHGWRTTITAAMIARSSTSASTSTKRKSLAPDSGRAPGRRGSSRRRRSSAHCMRTRRFSTCPAAPLPIESLSREFEIPEKQRTTPLKLNTGRRAWVCAVRVWRE